MFPDAGYGGRFRMWLRSTDTEPYGSYGNGSAMRVSPVAWFFDDIETVEKFAEVSARVTHNYPEGIKGAQSVAGAIFLARAGAGKEEIKTYVKDKYQYDLERTLDEIRPSHRFNETCQGSVPEAIIAFLESESFEDAVRKAISIGGDSDTIGAITGSVAEAYYGIPEDIKSQALSRLDSALKKVLVRWQRVYREKSKSRKDRG
jgi:ADP-ribosylglycohydrolase